MYAVIACPRCRRCKIVEAGRKTTTCAACDRTLVVREQRVWFSGADLAEAQRVAGLVNAKLAGRSEEHARALAPEPPRVARHDGPLMAAAAAARGARSRSERADVLARELSVRMGTFSEDDLARAFETAGLAAHEKHLARMLATHVLIEPRAGRYRAA